MGKIYQQTGIDTHSNVGFAKVYPDRTLTATDFLNDRVLPFFDEHGLRVLRILGDNGPEYCGRRDAHAYQLFLQLNEIEHTRIKVRHPQTNGAVERLNQTIQKEFYAVGHQLIPGTRGRGDAIVGRRKKQGLSHPRQFMDA